MRNLLLLLCVASVAACHHAAPTPAKPEPAADVPVSPDALIAYARETFPDAVAAGTIELSFGTGGVADEIVEELRLSGITTLSQFKAIVPPDFATRGIQAIKDSESGSTTVAGLVRDLVILHDPRGYFTNVYKHNWVASGPQDFPIELAYGVDAALLEELGAWETAEGEEDVE